MTDDLVNVGGEQPAVAPPATPEPEKIEDKAPEADKAAEAATEEGKQPDAAKTEAEKAAEASEAGKALNKRKQSYQERMNEITHKYRDEERRANRLAAQVAQLEGKIKAPIADEYTDPAKLNADQIAHALDKRRVQELKDEHAEATDEVSNARAVAWAERVNDFKTDNADFEQVAFAAQIGKETSLMVADMEDGPAVAYHLGKNPAEARRIEGLPERQRPFALGKLAAQLTAPPPRRVTSAPKPIDAATGKSAGATPDAGKIDDMDEYARLRKGGWKG